MSRDTIPQVVFDALSQVRLAPTCSLNPAVRPASAGLKQEVSAAGHAALPIPW